MLLLLLLLLLRSCKCDCTLRPSAASLEDLTALPLLLLPPPLLPLLSKLKRASSSLTKPNGGSLSLLVGLAPAVAMLPEATNREGGGGRRGAGPEPPQADAKAASTRCNTHTHVTQLSAAARTSSETIVAYCSHVTHLHQLLQPTLERVRGGRGGGQGKRVRRNTANRYKLN